MLAKNSSDREARVNLGSIYLTQGKPQPAVKLLSAAIADDPDDPELYFNLGIANHMLGRKRAALAAYKEFIKRAAGKLAWEQHMRQVELAILTLD